MALRCYFDLVCPYSYILGFEVERAEDDGLAEVDWLPFELRPAPKELPEPRGTYIRDHWRDHVYGLAATHEVEIHVPRYQPLTFPHEIRQYHQAEAGKVGAARDEEPAVVPLATASPRT